jgi:hypothetical protein
VLILKKRIFGTAGLEMSITDFLCRGAVRVQICVRSGGAVPDGCLGQPKVRTVFLKNFGGPVGDGYLVGDVALLLISMILFCKQKQYVYLALGDLVLPSCGH